MYIFRIVALLLPMWGIYECSKFASIAAAPPPHHHHNPNFPPTLEGIFMYYLGLSWTIPSLVGLASLVGAEIKENENPNLVKNFPFRYCAENPKASCTIILQIRQYFIIVPWSFCPLCPIKI